MTNSSKSSPLPSSGRLKVESDQQNRANGIGIESGEQKSDSGIHSETMGAESDIDELVDSDTEKRDSAPKQKGTKGRPKNGGAATKKSSQAASNPDTQKGISSKQQAEKQEEATGNGDHRKTVSKPSPTATPPNRNSPASFNRDQTAQSSDSRASIPVTNPSSSSREMSGRTATGGPVPYYYSAPGGQNARSANSPRPITFKKAVQNTAAGSKLQSGSSKNEGSSDGEDLTPLEVDKFLELIEKHNLDTSSEDDMARSVTELYQEWLEWCAKRSVQTTKSKQALVGEFQRIHSGYYGSQRQNRAVTIVQGSRTPMFGTNFDFVDGRSAGNANSGANEEFNRQRAVSRALKPRDSGANTSNRVPTSVTVGGNAKGRSVSPLPPAAYDDPYARNGIPPAVLDSLHRQIRDEIWNELGMSLSQAIRDETTDLRAENTELTNRVIELEKHSDRLAEWVQHLKSGQDEIEQSLRMGSMQGPSHPSAPPGAIAQSHLPPGPGRGLPHEEMIRDGMHPLPHGGPPAEYRPYADQRIGPTNGIDGPPGRGYAGPPYGPIAGPPNFSPETRLYPVARRSASPSKDAIHRSASRASQHRVPSKKVYDRTIGPNMSASDVLPHGGPPPSHAPPGAHLKHPSYPDSGRVFSGSASGPPYYSDEAMRNGPPPPSLPSHGAYMHDPRAPPPGSRGFYPDHPMEERVHYTSHPNSPLMATDPRMNKRARNGY